jgi:hypothetical protein
VNDNRVSARSIAIGRCVAADSNPSGTTARCRRYGAGAILGGPAPSEGISFPYMYRARRGFIPGESNFGFFCFRRVLSSGGKNIAGLVRADG